MITTTPLAFFSPGPMELVIIGVIAVLLFGSRLPSVMRNMGRGIVEFKKGVRGVEDDIESAAHRAPSTYDDRDEGDEASAPKFEPPPQEESASAPKAQA